jgi:hypothetical protein
MKKMLTTRFIPAIFVFIFMLPSLSFSAQDRRTALVIGNGSYKSSPLRNPVSDAKDMAEALRSLGFSVTLKTDANIRAMKKSIKDFGRNLRMGGVGLFYYAGHGMQVNGRNYLVPIGADVNTESEIEYEAVDAGRILGQMEDAGNGLNIIILDACRDNPFARSFRSSEKGLAKMDAPTGSFLAYATAPGSVAADGTGRNGLYTSKLLKHMVTPGLELEKLFKYVRIEVANASGTTQVPWESSSLMGNFYFNPKRGIAVVGRPSVAPQEPVVATPKYASISPKVTEPKIIERDGNFVKFDSGAVYDKNTGLEWYAGPNRGTDWYEAKSWVESLAISGGGWRMPTRDELRTIYKKGVGKRNRTPLLETAGWGVWSVETEGSSGAWVFSFDRGNEYWRHREGVYQEYVFAVRSRR